MRALRAAVLQITKNALCSEESHSAAAPHRPCCQESEPCPPHPPAYRKRSGTPPSGCDNARLKGQVAEHDVTSQLLAGLGRQLSRSLSCAWPTAARQPASTCDRFSIVNKTLGGGEQYPGASRMVERNEPDKA